MADAHIVTSVDLTHAPVVRFDVEFKDPGGTILTKTEAEDLTSLSSHIMQSAPGSSNTRIFHYMFKGSAGEAIKMLHWMAFDFTGFYDTWKTGWNSVAGVDPLPNLNLTSLGWLPTVQNSLLATEAALLSTSLLPPPPIGCAYKPCIAVLIAYAPGGTVISLDMATVYHIVCS